MGEQVPDRLYHYTNLETLALILEHQTIRLMPLTTMDDKQECMASDLEKMGQFSFVSCWTGDGEESIPMWSMYAGIECGVRISLPANPFVQYSYTVEELFNFDLSAVRTTGNPESFKLTSPLPPRYVEEGGFTSAFFADAGVLCKIGYTDDGALLEPQLVAPDGGRFSVATSKLGRYKNPFWEFQHEYRYIMEVFPRPFDGVSDPAALLAAFTVFANILVSDNLKCPFNYIDLDLSEEALCKMEVTLSPGMTEGNRLLARSLLNSHGLGRAVRPSVLDGYMLAMAVPKGAAMPMDAAGDPDRLLVALIRGCLLAEVLTLPWRSPRWTPPEASRRPSPRLPDYDLSDSEEVKLTIYGSVVDGGYTNLLMQDERLPFEDILALDRVQKRRPIGDQALRRLRRKGLVEGRRPHLRAAPSIVEATGTQIDYLQLGGQSDEYCCALITDYLRKCGHADRATLDSLVFPSLSTDLSDAQKRNKVKNLLAKLSRNGEIHYESKGDRRGWRLS